MLSHFDTSFLLWLNNILLYEYLFMCSSVDGHLDSFLFRAILNDSAVNIAARDM